MLTPETEEVMIEGNPTLVEKDPIAKKKEQPFVMVIIFSVCAIIFSAILGHYLSKSLSASSFGGVLHVSAMTQELANLQPNDLVTFTNGNIAVAYQASAAGMVYLRRNYDIIGDGAWPANEAAKNVSGVCRVKDLCWKEQELRRLSQQRHTEGG